MIDVPTIWMPQPGPQMDFCKSGVFEAFYGGSAGGGKSDALLGEASRQVDIPEYRAIIFRRQSTQLPRLIDRSKEIYRKSYPDSEYNDTTHTHRFKSGATIRFCHLQALKDIQNHDGQEYHFIGFDELTHFLEQQYLYLFSRARSSTPGLECYVRSTGMPYGIGLGWVKERFINNGAYNIVTDPETGLERVFIPAKLADNKALTENDPQYVNRLKALGPRLARALLKGDWDVIQGAAFEELDPDIHMLPAHEPPQGVLVWRVMDWGYAAPFSIGWYYEDNDGSMVRFREWYGYGGKANKGVKMGARDVAKEIKEIDALYNMSYGVADPSICIKTGAQEEGEGMPSIEENMLDEGVSWDHALNDRIQGKMEMHARLAMMPNSKCEQYPNGVPGLRVTENCKHFWRTVPMIQVDDKKPEDVDTNAEDHVYDEVRYSVMSRPACRGTGEVDFGTDRITAGQEFF